MAVITYRIGTAAQVDGNFGALFEADQTAATRTDGWTSAKLAAAQMSEFDVGVKQASGSFSATAKPASFLTGTTANAFKTSAPLKGDFANTAWTFTFALRCATASSQRGRMRMRVFKSANADGSSATELTGATQIGTTVAAALSTTVDQTSVITWSPGATITLNDEYLFFVLAWEITTAGGSNSADVLMRTGQAAGGSRLATPDFTSTAAPVDETSIDDFNRANGLVNAAGAGVDLWETLGLAGGVVATITGNAVGLPAAGAGNVSGLSKVQLQSDFDLVIDCGVAPVSIASPISIHFAISEGDTGTWDGLVAEILDSTAWRIRRYTNGTPTTLATIANSVPVAGEMLWVKKRGTLISFYRKPPAGTWTLVVSATDSTYNRAGPFAVQMQTDRNMRWDNLRGGPRVPITLSASDSVTVSDSASLVILPNETPIDDFNRADGVVHAGAGAGIWTNHLIGDAAVQTKAVVSGNQLAVVDSSMPVPVSIPETAADFDLLTDIVVGGATGFNLYFCLTGDTTALAWAGCTLGYDAGSNAWWGTVWSGGYQDHSLGSNPGVLPVAGETYWLRKRGTTVELYKAPTATQSWTLIGTWSGAPAGGGAFGIRLDDTTQRMDNLRGGPLVLTLNVADTVTVTDDASGIGIAYTLDAADTVTTSDSLTLADFSPLAISGCALWLDASRIAQAAGSTVPTWANLVPSGIGGSLLGSPAPVLRSSEQGINGLPVVRYTKGEGGHYGVGLSYDRNFTVFIVARMWGATRSRIFSSKYNEPGAPNALVGWWGTYEDKLHIGGWATPDPTTPASTNPKLYSADGAGANIRLFRDGVLYSSSGASVSGWAGTFHISPEGAGFTEGSDCEVAEIAVYDRQLSDTERQSVEAYLRTKWITPGAALTLGPSDGLADSVTISDAPSLAQDYALSIADSVTTSDDASGLSFDIQLSFADTVTTSDLADFAVVISKSGGGVEGSSAGTGKLVQVVQSGGGFEGAVGGAVWASNALKSAGGVEGQVGGGSGAKAFVVTKSGGATSAEVGDGHATLIVVVTKSGGATEGSFGGISAPTLQVSRSGGGISAESGAFMVGTVKVGGGISAEFGGISKTVTVDKQIQGVEGSVGGGAVSTLVLVTKSGGAVEGSVAGGTQSLALIIAKAGGAVEPQTAGALREHLLVKSVGGISNENASGYPSILVVLAKAGGGISSESGGGAPSALYLLVKQGGGIEIQVSGGQRQSIHSLVGGGEVSESGGGIQGLLLTRSGGAIAEEIGAFDRQTFYTKQFGGISQEIGGGSAYRVKAFVDGGAISREVGGGTVSHLTEISPGEGQPGELIGSEFEAILVGASNGTSTGQLVGATAGAMVLSGIEKAILVGAHEEATFE